MKTVKFLIVTAILSTSFYACKKEEMNIKSSEVSLLSDNQNSSSLEESGELTEGMIRIVFSNVGAMVIEGNPNLEKLISMYNASETAINSAKEVFELTNDDKLSIVFDRDGYAVASDIPAVPVGSNIDVFINDFCKVQPSSDIKLSITKTELERNYIEFWNAMPAGAIESFEAKIKEVQGKLPEGFTMQIQISTDHKINLAIIDARGNSETVENAIAGCVSNVTINFFTVGSIASCLMGSLSGWF